MEMRDRVGPAQQAADCTPAIRETGYEPELRALERDQLAHRSHQPAFRVLVRNDRGVAEADEAARHMVATDVLEQRLRYGDAEQLVRQDDRQPGAAPGA